MSVKERMGERQGVGKRMSGERRSVGEKGGMCAGERTKSSEF